MTNLKLIILGIGAMLATVLVFSVIGEIVTRPRSPEAQPFNQVSVSGTKTVTNTSEARPSSRTSLALAKATQPILQLTLPTRTITEMATPTSQPIPQPYPPPSLPTSEPYPPPSVSTLNPYPPPEETVTITVAVEPTSTSTLLAIPVLGSSAIQGRILFQGQVLDETVLLNLENQDLFTIQQITSPDGEYTIFDLLPSAKGYSILFSQDTNPGFNIDQVIRWGLVKTSPVLAGEMTGMPDLEISLMGLSPVYPLPNARLANGPISAMNPLRFEWVAYPNADEYWVELRSNRLSTPVWDSGFIDLTAVDFDGTLSSGATIQPGTYWWSVGVRIDKKAMTISSPVWEFNLDW